MKTTSGPVEASPASRVSGANWRTISTGVKAALRDQVFRWPLFLPMAMAFGAAAYMTWPTEPDWAVLVAGASAPFLSWAWLSLRTRQGGGPLAFAMLMLACAGLGGLAGKARSERVAAPVLLEQIGPVQIEGVIAELDASERSRRVRIAVRAIEGLTPEQTPRFVRFSYRNELGFGPGRAVSCRAILSPPPRPVVPGDYAFHRDAWFQQLGAVGFQIGECRPLATPPPATMMGRVELWIGAVRRAMAEHVSEAAGPGGGGMSAAMVSGDRSFITPDDAEALRLSGLSHLLSISGVHLVLVGGVVFFVIRFLWPLAEPLALRVPSVRAAAAGALIACTLYFAISGMEVATQRAWIMATIGFGAKLFDKPALSLRSIAVAMVVIVLLQPESVVTPGFQMSFGATASLIALYEIWPRLDRPKSPGLLARIGPWFVGAGATSLMASTATMPFALHHFDRAAIFSVVANVVSTPIISLWSTPAAIGAAVTAPFGLQEVFLAAMGASMEVVIAVAHLSATYSPDVDLPRLGGFGVAWAGAALVAFCVLTRRGRWLAIIPGVIAMGAWMSAPRAVGYVAVDGSAFLKADSGWVELTDWRGRNGLNPLIIGDEIAKAPCAGKGEACRLDLPAGRFAVEPDDREFAAAEAGEANGEISRVCPTTSRLVFSPADGSIPLYILPCDLAARGGAVIELTHPGRSLRTERQQTGRGWVQPLIHAPEDDRRRTAQSSTPQRTAAPPQ